MYWIFKTLFTIAKNIYFKNFKVSGKENLEHNGPVIYVANHPATFIDPIIVATLSRKKIHFIAKATLFKNKIVAFLLRQLNMIPVHRKVDGEGNMNKNMDTFRTCVNHLHHNGAILIFPEGISLAERKIKEVKTGAARIALEAIANGNENLNLKIICVGINYFDEAKFRSNVVVQIGTPIDVKNYLNRNDGVKALTDIIREQLEENTISIENKEHDVLIQRVGEIYTNDLLEELNLNKKNKFHHFSLTKSFCTYLNHFIQQEPHRIAQLQDKIDNYYSMIDQYKLKDQFIRRIQGKKRPLIKLMASMFFIALGLPFFLIGTLAHILPYQLTSLLSKSISKQKEYRVAIAFAGGTFLYLGYYFALYFLFKETGIQPLTAFLLVVSTQICGLFALYFQNFIRDEINKIKVLRLFMKNTNAVVSILQERKSILENLREFKTDYSLSQNENLIA